MPAEPADLVIRVGPLPDSDLIARRLLTTEAWTCASPAYLATNGRPATIAELGRHRLVAGFDRPTVWSYATPGGVPECFEFLPAAVVSDSAALLPAILGGAGIARLPDFLARAAVVDGQLVRLWPERAGELFDVHAIYPGHRSLSAKVRVFIDALIVRFGVIERA